MNNKGYYGISFPFRLSTRGGIAMSGTNAFDVSHIEESLRQILSTNIGERVNELSIGGNISYHLFNPTDEALLTLIKYEILEAIKNNEPRVMVENEDIYLEEAEEGTIIIDLRYKVIDYSNIEYNLKMKVGA